MILDLVEKKVVKIRYEEECNNIVRMIGSSRIDQEEALKGSLDLVPQRTALGSY